MLSFSTNPSIIFCPSSLSHVPSPLTGLPSRPALSSCFFPLRHRIFIFPFAFLTFFRGFSLPAVDYHLSPFSSFFALSHPHAGARSCRDHRPAMHGAGAGRGMRVTGSPRPSLLGVAASCRARLARVEAGGSARGPWLRLLLQFLVCFLVAVLSLLPLFAHCRLF